MDKCILETLLDVVAQHKRMHTGLAPEHKVWADGVIAELDRIERTLHAIKSGGRYSQNIEEEEDAVTLKVWVTP